ncbi:hypothetical protein [Shumkonia mesophila]|uniref:hypothetical protein n=1 Tax=Shumkonia mesophila TaxID=2838854 RepID=UPI00293524F1|nr:hypothetical protein [Shumkonia mesophila]
MIVPVRFDMGFSHVLDRQMETSSSMRRSFFPRHPNIEPGTPAKMSEMDVYLLTTSWFSGIFLSSNVRPMPFEEGAAGGNEFEIEHLARAFGLSKKS